MCQPATRQDGRKDLSTYQSFSYDAAGNRLGYVSAIDVFPNTYPGGDDETYAISNVRAMTYDARDELTQDERTPSTSTQNTLGYVGTSYSNIDYYTSTFSYDLSGNPTTFQGQSGIGFNLDNQISETGFSYDGNGNPTDYNSGAFGYDVENRLISCPAASSKTFSAAYDPDDLRTVKTAPVNGTETTTYFLTDTDGLPLAEESKSGTAVSLVNIYARGADGLREYYSVGGGTFEAIAYDPEGAVMCRVNNYNQASQLNDLDLYSAFGTRLLDQTTSQTMGQRDSVGFAGQSGGYTDWEILGSTSSNTPVANTTLMTHRYYDPSTGRFINRDPIGYSGGVNLYGYAENNPITRDDPGGLDWLDNAANFSAGVGDSLSFGLTILARKGLHCDDVVDKSSGAYIGGEVTETVGEVVLTGGGRVLAARAARAIAEHALKKGVTEALAKEALEKSIRAAARRKLARSAVNIVGREVDHLDPLLGHSGEALANVTRRSGVWRYLDRRTGAIRTMFPTLGVRQLANDARNLRAVTHDVHMARHAGMVQREIGIRLLYNGYTTSARVGLDASRTAH